jgi:hypothetical protein
MIAASSLRTTVPVPYSYVDGIIELDGEQVPVVYFRQEPNKPWIKVKPFQNLSGALNISHITARVAAEDKGSLKDLVASQGLPLNESAPDYTNYNEGKAIYVNESGLFAILLFIQKPELKLFANWVTSEVLPEIKRTGSYSCKSDKLPLATQNRVETAVDVFAHPPHDMVQQFWISAIKEKTLTFQAEEAWKRAVFKVNEEAHAKTSKADGEAHAWALKADAEARTQTLKADEEARQAVAEARTQTLKADEEARQAVAGARTQTLKADEEARQAVAGARTQTLKADEEAHARTSKADEEAHVRNSKADEEAHVRNSKADEEARSRTSKADEEAHAWMLKADAEARTQTLKADEEAKIKVIKSSARADLAKISAEKKRVVTVCKADELEAMERIVAATARLSSMPAAISPLSADSNALLEAPELATTVVPDQIAPEQPPVKRRRQIGAGYKPEFACYRAVGISDSDVPKDHTEANLWYKKALRIQMERRPPEANNGRMKLCPFGTTRLDNGLMVPYNVSTPPRRLPA